MGVEIRHIVDDANSGYKKKMDIEPYLYHDFKLYGLDEKDIYKNEIEWLILSQDKKKPVKKVLKKWDECFSYMIPDKLCGAYSYYLQASYKTADSHKLFTIKDGINLTGICDPEILSLYPIQTTVKPGVSISFTLETAGLNSNEIIVEAYNKKNKKLSTHYFYCVEGFTKVNIAASATLCWKREEEVYLKIKAQKIRKKDSEAYKNEGYLKINGEFEIMNLTVIKEDPVLENEIPKNKTISEVNGNTDSPQKEVAEGSEFVLRICKTSEADGSSTKDKYKKENEEKQKTDDKIELTEINKGEEVELDPESIMDIDVCAEYEFIVHSDGKTLKGGTIDWYIIVKEDNRDKEYSLKELKDRNVIKYPHILSGNRVYFRIPPEFGQKEVTIAAKFYNENKKLVQLKGKFKVIDNIIAAFYRLDTEKEHSFELKGIIDIKNSWNAQSWIPVINWPLKVAPLYHIQGMYREGNDLYFTGSVRAGTSAYLFKITGISDDGDISAAKHHKSFIFGKGALSYFDHPGGVQVSNNIIALGFEKYDDLGLQTVGGSLVSFFDTEGGIDPEEARNKYEKMYGIDKKNNENKEYKKIRIVQDTKYIDKYDDEFDKIYDIEGNLIETLWYRCKEGNGIQVHKIDNKYKRLRRTLIKRNMHGSDNNPVTDRDLYPSLGIYDDVYKTFEDAKNGDRSKLLIGIPAPNDQRASATGIVYLEKHSMFLVAVRGFDNAVQFYKLELSENPKVKNNVRTFVDKHFSKLATMGFPLRNVGDFQNVNLHLDEKGDIYMFGMGDEDVENVCRMYKVILDINNDRVELEGVYIDTIGHIKSAYYAQVNRNKRAFVRNGSKMDPGFFWSSCVYIKLPTENKAEKGFQGKFTIYTSDSIVRNSKLKCKYFTEKETL